MRNVSVVAIDHSEQMAGGQWSLIRLLQASVASTNPVSHWHVIYNGRNTQFARELERLSVSTSAVDFTASVWIRALKIYEAARTVTKANDNVVFYGNTYEGGWWAGLYGRILCRRSIFRVRLAPTLFSHGVIDYIVFFANQNLIFNSFFVEAEFRRRFGALSRLTGGKVIYNKIDDVSLIKDEDFQEPGIVKIGLIGRFEKIKNQRLVPPVARYLLDCGIRDFSISIIGQDDFRDDGAYRRAVEADVEQFEVGAVVEVVQDRFSPDLVYFGLDAILTLSEVEALPRVVCEAGLRGITNIAVARSGSIELVSDDPNAIQIFELDVKSIAEAIEHFLKNFDRYLNRRQLGRNYYQNILSDSNTVKKELDFIAGHQIVENPRSIAR